MRRAHAPVLPVQVGDRLSKVEAAQSRLRWHVDKDNKGAVTVMDVDRAFPPHISLVERVGTLIDTLPDTCVRPLHALQPPACQSARSSFVPPFC